ncbi:MAG: acyl-CoA dehydrogenase family protein, partial [Deltaproteobacteria bacterium]|nr:acyl-CoA dehydrogenase family protein [Deltaproteobacteria bacterium]
MQLLLNDDQSLLAETARGLVSEHASPARLRRLREDPIGFEKSLWARIVELGWAAIPFAEDDGGLGLGLADVACVTEALGRGLAPEPYVSNVLLAGGLVAALGSPTQREAELAPMLTGARHLAFAGAERGARFDLTRGSTTAERSGAGYRLRGEKPQVLGGSAADTFVVLARTSGSPGERA